MRAFALTFDDGPGDVTGPLLDVLARHGARATFFWIGVQVAGHEALVERAAREGHEIAVHGWTHDDHRDDPVPRAAGVARTADLLASICGVRPARFRPPYGYTNEALEAAVAEHGLETIIWDVDPRDWEEPGPAVIHDRVVAELRPDTVLLLHENRQTLEAIDPLLGGPLADWRAVTVAQLGTRPRQPASSSRSALPEQMRSPSSLP
jgi:peptidoglycan-N-acetylglucosamine deacetylase